MTGRSPMPSQQAVRDALASLRTEAETTGRHPSVLALAERVGLPNTTFRRRYPDICAELTPRTTARNLNRASHGDHLLRQALEAARNVTRLADRPARRAP